MFSYLPETEALIQYAYEIQMLCTFALGRGVVVDPLMHPIGVGV